MTDHVCTISLARDGGHNYGAASEHDIGATGDFCKAAIRLRCGQSRQMVAEVSVSSPFRATVIALAVQAEQSR